jgi:hypothetical protein
MPTRREDIYNTAYWFASRGWDRLPAVRSIVNMWDISPQHAGRVFSSALHALQLGQLYETRRVGYKPSLADMPVVPMEKGMFRYRLRIERSIGGTRVHVHYSDTILTKGELRAIGKAAAPDIVWDTPKPKRGAKQATYDVTIEAVERGAVR